VAALDVLPLDVAKRYLNIDAGTTAHDDELADDFIPPAVARVERHVGRTFTDYESVGPLERLALKMVLAEFWRTQSVSATRSYNGSVGQQSYDADSDPAGTAPLRVRLEELLGEEAPQETASVSSPQGSFPEPSPWPDPAERGRCW
jgi:uncharacterized phage protein (predicted DNA packaging)